MKSPQSIWKALNKPYYLRYAFRPWMIPLVVVMIIDISGYGLWKMSARNPAAIEPPQEAQDQVELRFYDVELRGREQGTPFFVIFADEVEVTRDNRYVNFKEGAQKPHGEFFNLKDWEQDLGNTETTEDNKRRIVWEARKATYDRNQQDLRMEEDVKVITDTKDIVLTDELLWQKKDESLSSQTRSKVRTHKGAYMTADTMDVKTKDKEMYLEGRVYIEMPIKEEQELDVEAFEKK